MDTKEQIKKNAEFILAKLTENFEITKVTPFKEVINEELGNDLEFSFEIITYVPNKTPNDKGMPFTVTISSDNYVYFDGLNTCIEFPIEDLNNPQFFDNFLNEF